MRKSILKVFLVLVSFDFVVLVSCDFVSLERTDDIKCEDILKNWIDQASTKFHVQNSTLEVNLQPPQASPRAKECFGKSQVKIFCTVLYWLFSLLRAEIFF